MRSCLVVLTMLAAIHFGDVAQAQYAFEAWEPPPTQQWPVQAAFQFSGLVQPSVVPPSLPSMTTELPPAMPQDALEESIAHPAPATANDLIGIPTESWFWPTDWLWCSPSGWDGSFEIGVNATAGNAEAFSFRTGGNLKRKIEKWEFTSDILYSKTISNGIESQHNAILNAGYERTFGESSWSHFGKLYLEYDEFKAYDLRIAINSGFGYLLVKTDATTLKGRFGAGVSHEVDSPDMRWVPEAVLGGDFRRQLSKRQKLSFTTDYFPEWDGFANFRLVTNLGWEMFLDDSSKLSLKLSVNDRYDSTPNGRKPNDVLYAFLLLWKI